MFYEKKINGYMYRVIKFLRNDIDDEKPCLCCACTIDFNYLKKEFLALA